MHSKSRILLLAFTIMAFNLAYSQSLDMVQGEFLVQTKNSIHPQKVVGRYVRKRGNTAQLQVERKLKAPMSVWKLRFDHNAVAQNRLLAELSRDPDVMVIQNNHLIESRQTIPDDPQFSSQWHWLNDGSAGTEDADVDADLAWDIATGGQTPDGDDIVVAVLDDGTDLDHEDLMANHWTNEAEIPNNGVDDDGNGYVDDYNGWSIISNNDNVDNGSHGVAVSGMIGAVGNNGIGVTGINWNVKIMMVKNNFNTQEDRVLEAYAYPYIMRKRYNESNGTEGAFVVSTNASWGIDFGNPEDSPLWCQFYDSLGVQGILNCGATSNQSIDIDVEGDLPTGCPSDFMVSVTRSGNEDQQGGGYGPIAIDLAAPGINVFTTAGNGGYNGTTGTSFASPLVAGIIGLLYSAPCPNLTAQAKSDPYSAALEARRLLLENVDPIAGYESLVATGGRANAFRPMNEIINNCGPCPLPSAPNAINIGAEQVDLTWNNNPFAISASIRYRAVGAADWIDLADVQSPYKLMGLELCSSYEFQVMNACDGSEFSDFSPAFIFKTDGCCEPPSNVAGSQPILDGFTVNWESVLIGLSYDVRYRVQGTTDWTTVNSTMTSLVIDGLAECENYEVEVRTKCPNEDTEFSNPIILKTKGCGICEEGDYCVPAGNSNFEFIEGVNINGAVNMSGDNDGYIFFDNISAFLNLGPVNELVVDIGYGGASFEENVVVYLDVNQDGIFQSDELILSTAGEGTLDLDLDVPLNTLAGLTRLRVMLVYQEPNANPCGVDFNGEIEDYCVMIELPTDDCLFEGTLDTISTTVASISLSWPDQIGAIQYQVRYKESTSVDWTGLVTMVSNTTISGLKKCTDYDFQIATFCNGTNSAFTDPITFPTRCASSLEELNLSELTVFPNPFKNTLQLNFFHPSGGEVALVLYNTIGERVTAIEQQRITAGNNQLFLNNLEELTDGIYFLELVMDNQHQFIKVIKQQH